MPTTADLLGDDEPTPRRYMTADLGRRPVPPAKPRSVVAEPAPRQAIPTALQRRMERRLAEETESRKPEPKKEPAPFSPTEDDSEIMATLDRGEMVDPSLFVRPVNITFLAKVLGKETRRLHARLSNCPIVGYEKMGRNAGKSPLYDFKVAIQYCVEPKVDLEKWIKSQSVATLPPMIAKAFWEAMRTKMRVMAEAGDLWPTEDVLHVLGEVAITIKTQMQLWVENLPNSQSMSTEQYESFRKDVKSLQDEVHRLMIEMPKRHKTESYQAVINDIIDGDTNARMVED